MDEETVEAYCRSINQDIEKITREISRVVVGHESVIRELLIAFFSSGHVLFEGMPGLGKTLLASTLSSVFDLEFRRIQFTPDLMPADITGTDIVSADKDSAVQFEFFQGPVFCNILLADEINRSTPKTQSALLEAMQETSVTVGGKTHAISKPFLVIATQNPIDLEGTYPLPEAQIDRFFFKITVCPPALDEMVKIVDRTTEDNPAEVTPVLNAEKVLAYQQFVRTIPVSSEVKKYAARIVLATSPQAENTIDEIRQYVRFGASPRGTQALILGSKVLALTKGRLNVSVDDIKEVAVPALRHRCILSFDGESAGIQTDSLIKKLTEFCL